MTLVLATRQPCGGFLCETSSRLCKWGDRRIIFFLVGRLSLLEPRNCQRDTLRKGCVFEIFGGACSEMWLGKLKVMVASNQTN